MVPAKPTELDLHGKSRFQEVTEVAVLPCASGCFFHVHRSHNEGCDCRCPGSKHRWTQSGSLIAASSASLSRTKATHCQSFLGTLLSQLLQIGQQLQKQSTWTVEKRAEEPKL